MSNILISTESRFPINRKAMRKAVEDFLGKQQVKSEVEVSIAIVGDRKMRSLNQKYRKLDQTTPVLTFNIDEGKPFVMPPDGVLRLGDIVISYPQAVDLARTENKLVDTVLGEFIVHGLRNLLGLNS